MTGLILATQLDQIRVAGFDRIRRDAGERRALTGANRKSCRRPERMVQLLRCHYKKMGIVKGVQYPRRKGVLEYRP